jgi:hypothetical protein
MIAISINSGSSSRRPDLRLQRQPCSRSAWREHCRVQSENTLFFACLLTSSRTKWCSFFSQDKKDPKKFRGFSYPTYVDVRSRTGLYRR